MSRGWLKRLWRTLAALRHPPPAVVIHCDERAEGPPRVSVAIWSRRGGQELYSFEATLLGAATATMRARMLAHILDAPLLDDRVLAGELDGQPNMGDGK